MLSGLSINRLSRRHRKSHGPAQTADGADDNSEISVSPSMSPALASQSSLPATPVKPQVAVAVQEVRAPDAEETVELVKTQSTTHSQVERITTSYQVTHVHETARSVVSRIVEQLDEVNDDYFESLTLDAYLENIADERLMHMPRKGSQWDRVLKSAEYFGIQIDRFSHAVAHFVPQSQYIARSALGGLQLLLELGHRQAEALEPTFTILSDFGVLLSQIVLRGELVEAPEPVRDYLADIYTGLVSLIGDIAVYYRSRISSMSTHQTGSIDFDATFGKAIDRIWMQKEHLSNHLWSFKLRSKRYAFDIESLRRKLATSTPTGKTLLYERIGEQIDRADGTCDWFQSYLLDFLRSGNSVFSVHGASGVGKSVLLSWARERLQRPLGRVKYEALTHVFPYDNASQRTSLSFLKGVLSQLVERNVGDVHLFESLVSAFQLFETTKDNKKLENALWTAVHTGLKTLDNAKVNAVLLLDGIDQVEHAKALAERVYTCIDSLPHVRAVFFSKNELKLGPSTSHFHISAHENSEDIARYLRNALQKHQHFQSQDHDARNNFVKELVGRAQGSFLYAFLAHALLSREESYEKFYSLAAEMPRNVHGILHKLSSSIDWKNHTTKNMLSFMLATERPLTVREMEELLGVDLKKHTVHPFHNVRDHIKSHCRSLVVERHGIIHFKHAEIRAFAEKELAGHQLLSSRAAHTELSRRLLFYAKHTFTASFEPSFDLPSTTTVDNAFRGHALTEYVIRHWVMHFRSSAFCGSKDEILQVDELKSLFPDSTFFALMEWTCWQHQFSVERMTVLHEFALRVRTACFGEKHQSVMQSLIILGCLFRTTDVSRAGEYLYRASVIGQAVLFKFSAVVVACTSTFLSITAHIKITTRTTVVTYREEMIRFMIEICTTKHGKSSDQVIKWYETLAELYICIKEEYRATVIYKELYEIIVIRFGKDHPKAKGLEGTIRIQIKGGENEGDILKYNGWIFETDDEEEEFDVGQVDIILKLVLRYEAEKKWTFAERLILKLWQRVSIVCRTKGTIELHKIKIRIALEYARFLQRIERIEDACNILVALWAEYEHRQIEEMTFLLIIKEIGIVCRSFGLLTVAVSIFGKVWGWFKRHGKTDHEEATSTTILITEVVEEIEETTITKKTTTTTTTTITETLTREIFETTYTRCKHGKVDKHFFAACMALVNFYIRHEKWSECEVIIKRSLEITWKAILEVDVNITLTGTFTTEYIRLATQLAICYHRQHDFEKAERIYLRIYRACLASFAIEHICVQEASWKLIQFYEEHHRHEKVIEIYLELLQGYRKHCGATHKLTIKTLYALGAIYMTLGRKEAYEYYIEIVRVLNTGGHCHHDAFDAAIIVCGYYYEHKRWVELRKECHLLWEAFVHHHHDFVFTEAMIITLYERYRYVLEMQVKVEFSVLYKLTVQYKETVIKRFGASSAILITALIALASICEKSEEHWHESITIYEEVIKKTTTITTTTTVVEETTIKTVKKRLSKMYVTIITHGKSTSHTTIERAIVVAWELFQSLKIEFGCWHETTLTQLRELCILYHKHGKTESHDRMILLLQTTIVEIVTHVTTAMTLYTSATMLASIYVSCGIVKIGQDILHQMRHLIVLHEMDRSKEITITFKGRVSKLTFVFLIAFEHGLKGRTALPFTEAMGDILLESYLFEEYTQVMKVETKIEVVLEVCARLRSFWIARGRTSECEVLDHKVFALFLAKYKHRITVGADFTFIFYDALLVELGKDRAHVDFAKASCASANAKVKSLLQAGEFRKAHEVAKCAFQFISSHKWYHSLRFVGYGYKLAEYLAGIDVPKAKDEKLQSEMRGTAVKITHEVLAACEAAKLDFVTLQYGDLCGLVRLLGEIHEYKKLESILMQLWRSREVQKTWQSETILAIGTMLVHAHMAAGDASAAIDLCYTICYNLRRSRGWLDPSALRMSRLLAALYTAQGQHASALAVHEEILRELDEDGAGAAEAERNPDVHDFLELLKRAVQRLGGFGKRESALYSLFHSITRHRAVKDNVQHIDQWTASTHAEGKAEEEYHLPEEWLLALGQVDLVPTPPTKEKREREARHRRQNAVRRSCGYASFFDKEIGSEKPIWEGKIYT